MRAFAVVAIVGSLAPLAQAADKLSLEDRIELTRGLSYEYANVKVLLPHSKKALEFDAKAGTYDRKAWSEIAKTEGPAARTGDTIQVTKIDIDDDRITMQINGGYSGGRKWYQAIQVSGGTGNGGNPVPISNRNGESNAPAGTSIVVMFHKPLDGLKASAVKKMLAPILDFDKHSVTEVYTETLPPEMQKAIKDRRALVGMDKEQVRLALGTPVHRERSTAEDGGELEDWVYGKAPGKITFVTFNSDKVIKVKEDYAGLGTSVGSSGPIK